MKAWKDAVMYAVLLLAVILVKNVSAAPVGLPTIPSDSLEKLIAEASAVCFSNMLPVNSPTQATAAMSATAVLLEAGGGHDPSHTVASINEKGLALVGRRCPVKRTAVR